MEDWWEKAKERCGWRTLVVSSTERMEAKKIEELKLKRMLRKEGGKEEEDQDYGSKVYRCTEDGCGKAFTSQVGLNHHERQIHMRTYVPLDLPCPTCERHFTSNSGLTRHALSCK